MRHLYLRLLPALLVLATILAALPTAGATPACPGGELHEKAARGLMPPVCLPAEEAPQLAATAPSVPFLAAPINTTVGSWAQVLAAADLGGDGRAEAAVLTARNFDPANDAQLHLYLQEGSSFRRVQQLPAGATPEAVATLDVNLDGRRDLVVALAGDQRLAVFLQGTEYLAAPAALAQFGAPDALVTGDFNGDLRPDLAVALPLSDTIRLWLSSPAGLAPQNLNLPFASDGYNALAGGDFNNDGLDDLAALRGSDDPSNARRDLVTVFLQKEAAFTDSFTLSPETGGYLPQSLASGDVNSDGRDDLVVTAGGNEPAAFLNVYLQGDSGLVRTPAILPAYHLPSAIVIADVNHDGREDVVVAHDGWRTVSVYTQNASGTLDPYAVATVPYSSRYRPDALDVADLNGDGGLDVALVSRTPGLTVLNNTAGAPIAAITSPVPYATLPYGTRTISGTTSAGTTRVEVRVRGLTGWLPATLDGTNWRATVELPAVPRTWWIEARATDAAGRVQAPPARHRVKVFGRVRDGLLVEYPFDEREGTLVHDRGEIGAPLDLNLADANTVSRVPEGVFVHTPTRIASPAAATKVISALKGANAFTLEAWIRPANLTQDGPARILTLSNDSQHLNVSLVQSRFDGATARIGLRLNTNAPFPKGEHSHLALADLPLTTDLTHVLVTRAADGTVIFYLNGVEQGRSLLPGDFSSWEDSYPLLFANDALVERPWLGEYHLAAIYQRALTAAEAAQNYAAGPLGEGSPAQITDAQLVYTFNNGSGVTVNDSAAVLPLLPAQIADPAAVSWQSGSLNVTAPTIIASAAAATKISRASMATGEITIEAWVTPALTAQNGPARIATISKNVSLRNVTLAQGLWGNERSDLFLTRLRSTTTSLNGEPHLQSRPGTLTPALTHVVYTRDGTGKARLYLNGVEQAGSTVGGDFTNWDADYRLALANEFTMNRSWLGSYHFLAFYSRALSASQISARFAAGAEGDGSQPPVTSVGPFVQQVEINGGAATTATREVTLTITVGGEGGAVPDQLTVVEYGFDANQGLWKQLQRGTPVAATTLADAQTRTYAWTLTPGAGVRYLQVWATDRAGTRSSYPYQTFINLIPEQHTVARGKTDVYRFALHAGEPVTVQAVSSVGDADLYIWGPAGDASMRWAGASRGSSDTVSFTPPVDGVYQVEVRGHTRATYHLSISVAAEALAGPAVVGTEEPGTDPEAKVLPDAPVIALDSQPTAEPVAEERIFLPIVIR